MDLHEIPSRSMLRIPVARVVPLDPIDQAAAQIHEATSVLMKEAQDREQLHEVLRAWSASQRAIVELFAAQDAIAAWAGQCSVSERPWAV